jgi:hypothetical protein
MEDSLGKAQTGDGMAVEQDGGMKLSRDWLFVAPLID